MKVLFIERRPYASTSIERVFAQVGKDLIADGWQVEFQKLPYKSTPFGIIGNLLFFRPNTADVYHLTGDGGYMLVRLPSAKTVVTIHDMIGLHTRRGPRRRMIKWLFFDIAAKRGHWITAVSNATRDELVSYYGWIKEKVRVIADPLLEGFRAPAPKNAFDGRPVVLQVGTAPNKNIHRLIEAMRGVDAHLRIIGRLDEDLHNLLETEHINFSNVEDITDQDMIREYQSGSVVTVCSTYEGFGLPIIEAQAVGIPVVVSNIPPMTEVAGDGAIFVDPLDPGSIRAGIVSALENTETRRVVTDSGFENVRRFRSADISMQYAELYREILASRTHK